MKNTKRHFVMFVSVFLLACCSLWAFPGRAKAEEILPVIPEIQAVIPILPPEQPEPVEPILSAPEPLPPSDPIADEGLTQLLSLLETFENASRLNKDELAKLVSELETIKTEYELIVEDVEEKEEQIEELKTLHAEQLAEISAINGKQADDLAYLRGAYDKETATKAYAKLGAVIGFDDLAPAYGVSAALGCRFGKGLLLELGAQYMIGSIKDPLMKPSLDHLAVTGAIGWEW